MQRVAKNLTDIYVGVKKDDPNRKENDFYPTPPLATYILCKYVRPPQNVVEPCAGRGNISIELQRNGHNVKSFDLNEYDNNLVDIETGIDVLGLERPKGYDGFITNPPYHKDLPRKIAEKAVSEYPYVAMFVRLTFLEGKKRKNLFTKYPPSDIIFLSDRINFGSGLVEPINKTHQLGGMIAYMWIVWDRRLSNLSRSTKLHWVLLEDEYDEWRTHYDQRSNSSGG
jgi:hypothetical protein